MCVGAMLECDVAALVYAVPNPIDGAAGTVLQLAQHPGLGRRLEVVSGIRRAEAEELMARSSDAVPVGRLTAPGVAAHRRPAGRRRPSGRPLVSSPAERCPSG